MAQPLKHIMHVDDDHVLRLMVKTALLRSPHGFEVSSCASGKDALDQLDKFQPDLVLIDYLMPTMNGIELARKIRSLSSPFSHVPFVFISGKDEIDFGDRAPLEPIIGLVRKPFSPAEFVVDILRLWDNHTGHPDT